MPMPDNPARKLAAILAADIVGYSALMGVDQSRTVSDLWNKVKREGIRHRVAFVVAGPRFEPANHSRWAPKAKGIQSRVSVQYLKTSN
jgi:methanogenic corrinoid protein MtbC1